MKLLYFQMMKRNLLVPFRTTKGFHLPITFIGLADLFPKLGSWHVQICLSNMYLALMVQRKLHTSNAGGPRSNPWGKIWYYFAMEVGGPRSNWVFIVSFGIILVQQLTWEWLWTYSNEIWERVLANSLKGIYKLKIVHSAGEKVGNR